MAQTQVEHSDSIDGQSHHDGEKKPKSRRPPNTAFRQQRLKAWQPILTPKTVLPLFFVIGILFAPAGGLLFWASSKVEEIVLDYTKCGSDAPEGNEITSFKLMPSDNYNFHFKSDITNEGEFPTWARHNEKITYKNGFPTAEKETDGLATVDTTVCSIQFTIPDPIGPPVLFYYRLTNFYQNHRRYVKSLDTDQLSGKKVAKDTIAGGSCDPLKLNSDGSRPYYPCGLIANSVFNDTFASPRNLRKTGDTATYSMSNKGIAWDSDKKLYGKTQYNVSEIAVPLNWQRRYGPEGYTTSNGPPDLSQYEEFQVWMRTAGLPAFSKLALRNDKDEMEAGRYQVDINLNFDVQAYGGTKSIVISTRTAIGGRNPFLGIAYIVVGGLCVILGIVFTVAHMIKPRKLGDHTYLTWNNDQPSTATATGVSRPGNDAA